jgi:acetyl esterase/lipase
MGCGAQRCALEADVLTPTSAAGAPIVVALPGAPGGPGGRSALVHLATALAADGIVVVLADYRANDTGGGFPETLDDAACAVAFAQARGAEFGGDPGRIILVGHSLGATVTILATLGDWSARGSDCLHPVGVRPAAIVPIGGVVTADPRNENYVELLGGTPAEQPDAWAAFDGMSLVDGSDVGVIVRLVNGSREAADVLSENERFATVLAAAGVDAATATIEGASHATVVDPRYGGAATVEYIADLALGLEPNL